MGIYTGEGASHSWTWFVESLERMEGIEKYFLDEDDIGDGFLSKLDAFFIGGGDVYGMATALGPEGADALVKYVNNGGTYVGSCAGAYLVMSGVDLPPYSSFNLLQANMDNYAVYPPLLAGILPKFKVPYGEGHVFYPVYGPVCVEMEGPWLSSNNSKVVAPLYGGPVIVPGEDVLTLGRYGELQKGCLTLAEEGYLSQRFRGGCAGAFTRKGKGRVFVFGPHFECPDFPEGNGLMEEVMKIAGSKRKMREEKPVIKRKRELITSFPGAELTRKLLREIKGELSNARIVAFGLEKMPVSWTMGTKTWEPEKIRYYIDFCWRRLDYLEDSVSSGMNTVEELEALAAVVAGSRELTRKLKREIDMGAETTPLAKQLFRHLKRQTVMMLEVGSRKTPENAGSKRKGFSNTPELPEEVHIY